MSLWGKSIAMLVTKDCFWRRARQKLFKNTHRQEAMAASSDTHPCLQTTKARTESNLSRDEVLSASAQAASLLTSVRSGLPTFRFISTSSRPDICPRAFSHPPSSDVRASVTHLHACCHLRHVPCRNVKLSCLTLCSSNRFSAHRASVCTLYNCNFSLTIVTSNFCAVWYLTSSTTGFKRV